MASVHSQLQFLIVVGVGFFGDGWLNSTIGLVIPMLGYLYFQDDKNAIPTISSDVIKASFSIGMILGQLLFGVFGDAIGRHHVYGKELIVTIVGTFLTIMMPWSSFSHHSVIVWMCFFRMLTGIGVGGDYPMSSTIAAENTRFKSRARVVLTIFSSGGLGYVIAGILYLVLLVAYKNRIEHDIQTLQWVWRLLFGTGLIPLIGVLYHRLTMPESKPYEQYVATETSLKSNGKRGLHQQWQDFREYFSEWKHLKTLLATSIIWFLFDLAFYGVNLNQSTILSQIGYANGKTPWEKLYQTAEGNLIVGIAGYLPGYYFGAFLSGWIGHRTQQLLGCIIVTILYAIWAGVNNHTSTGGLITLFTLSQFFLNAGLSSTTFLIPVEVLPTRVRATAHGIASASGKLGAVLTALVFGIMSDRVGIRGCLGFLTGCTAICGILTLLIPETKGRTLDDIEKDVIYGGGLGQHGDGMPDEITTDNSNKNGKGRGLQVAIIRDE